TSSSTTRTSGRGMPEFGEGDASDFIPRKVCWLDTTDAKDRIPPATGPSGARRPRASQRIEQGTPRVGQVHQRARALVDGAHPAGPRPSADRVLAHPGEAAHQHAHANAQALAQASCG